MPVLATGTSLGNQLTFNAGTLDINGYEVAQLQDITISLSLSQKELYSLGSIKMQSLKRYGFKPSAKAKVKSVNQQLLGAFMGSSGTDGSGLDYIMLDGQNVLSRASIKVVMNDNTAQVYEFQFTNAILGGTWGLALKSEDFGEADIEIMGTDVTVVANYTSL